MQSAPKPATMKGPKFLLRFRSKAEFESAKKAAKSLNIAANTFMLEAVVKQASEVFQSQKDAVRV